MRRSTLLLFLLLLAVPAPAAAAHRERATVEGCRPGASPGARLAVFTGTMPARAGTVRMAMRFTLQQRLEGQPWVTVRAPTFGVWERSKARRAGFVYTKRVDGLSAPAEYRAVVRFRWYGAGGRLQHAARRVTRACAQPDPRPTLVAGALSAAPGPDAGSARYLLEVRNDGRTAAGAFDAELIVDGAAEAARARVGGLPAGTRRRVEITAARCRPGSSVEVRLDPAREVAQADETDAVVRRACPA